MKLKLKVKVVFLEEKSVIYQYFREIKTNKINCKMILLSEILK